MTAVDLNAPAPHGRTYWLLSDVWNIVRRGLTHYRRQPVTGWRQAMPVTQWA
ncbi:ABC transporter permease, partial [Streptomyces sp. NPDC003832]